MKRVAVLACLLLASQGEAKPLITHSEETAARMCLAGRESPDRLIPLCDAALTEPAMTASSRSELLTAKAGAYFDLGDHARAEALYGDAIAADGHNIQALNGLGWVLWDLNRHAEAATAFRRSVDLNTSGNGLSGLASASFRSGQIDLGQAVEMLDAAVSIDPGDGWSHREKGWLLRQSGQFEVAMDAFSMALSINPDDDNAHYGMGRATSDLGRHDEALESYARAIALNDRDLGPYLHRSYALRALDRNAQAIRDAERVIALAPGYSGGYVEKALALVALKQRSQAIGILEAAREQGIVDNYLLYWFADTLSEDGQNERALAVIDEALSLDGREAVDYSLKAYIANRLDRFDAAFQAAEQAVEKDPNLAYAHYHAAVALLGQGDAEGGMARFDLAMKKGLPAHMVGEFATQLASRGNYLAAIALRGKY